MRILPLICLSFFALKALAQKPFEGRIEFEVEYLSMPEGWEGVDKMLPQKATWVVRGGQTRILQHVPLAGWQVLIYRPQLDSFYQQIELFDQQMLFAKPLSFEPNRYRAIPQSETKEIVGLETKKMILQSAFGQVIEVWYTPKFSNTLGTELPEIKGLPLQFEVVRNGIKYRITALSIKEESVDDTYFLIPNDVVRIHVSELQKILE